MPVTICEKHGRVGSSFVCLRLSDFVGHGCGSDPGCNIVDGVYSDDPESFGNIEITFPYFCCNQCFSALPKEVLCKDWEPIMKYIDALLEKSNAHFLCQECLRIKFNNSADSPP